MKNCAYEDVHCTNVECNELMPRRTLQYHLVSKCRWRVVSCQFCSEMYTYKDSKVGMTCRFFVETFTRMRHFTRAMNSKPVSTIVGFAQTI